MTTPYQQARRAWATANQDQAQGDTSFQAIGEGSQTLTTALAALKPAVREAVDREAWSARTQLGAYKQNP